MGKQRLLECPALANLTGRVEFFPLVIDCSGVMASLVWAKDRHMIKAYTIEREREREREGPLVPSAGIGLS